MDAMSSKRQDNSIDPMIHQPTRLQIVATLSAVKALEFGEIKARLSLTDGNLSTHLTHLESAGYVRIRKVFKGKKPKTIASLTAKGRRAMQQYIEQMQQIIDDAHGAGKEQ
jgi:DNA-binding MarR family transcriptional regulator